MKTKTLKTLLAAALVLSVFTACSQETPGESSHMTDKITEKISETEKITETQKETFEKTETESFITVSSAVTSSDTNNEWSEVYKGETLIPAPGKVNYRDGKVYTWYDEMEIIDGIHSYSYFIIDGILIDYVGSDKFQTWHDEINESQQNNIAEFCKKYGFEKYCRENGLSSEPDEYGWISGLDDFLFINVPKYGLEYDVFTIRKFCDQFKIDREEFQNIIDEDEIGHLQYAYNLDEIFPETVQSESSAG